MASVEQINKIKEEQRKTCLNTNKINVTYKEKKKKKEWIKLKQTKQFSSNIFYLTNKWRTNGWKTEKGVRVIIKTSTNNGRMEIKQKD